MGYVIPKTIWMFWAQGYENAPNIIKKCRESWEKYNPDWTINVLDMKNLTNFLPDFWITFSKNIDFLKSNLAALSDLLRINLLCQYGGVWVDATCFCCLSLDDWLTEYTKQGFFALNHINKNKLIDSWFLAADKESYLIQQWCAYTNSDLITNRYKAYWHNFYRYENNLIQSKNLKLFRTIFLKIGNKLREGLLKYSLRDPKSTLTLVNPFIQKFQYLYYFYFHFHFTKLVFRDSKAKTIWDSTPHLSCNEMLVLGGSELVKIPLSENLKIREHIDQKKAPLYKLTHKSKYLSSDLDIKETALYYLIAHHLGSDLANDFSI
ncbi:capsular polysaccharide synthesis protein [Microcystis aeruginosa FBCC-A68]|nr:capsular polysaccharide synthesis protein [Microcystis aeruginosa]